MEALMPVGRVDYRARLAGPGTQDVLGMILRGIAMPGGRQAAPDDPVDPETGALIKEMFGTAPAPERRPLRPDEQAALVDRKAREVHRKIVGSRIYGDSSFGVGSEWPPRPAMKPPSQAALDAISPSMSGQTAKGRMPELPAASGVSYGQRLLAKGTRSTHLQDIQAETGKIEREYQALYASIRDDAVKDFGPELAAGMVEPVFGTAESPKERLKIAREVWKQIQEYRRKGGSYWGPG
jgi:hypothetical protein